jgi:hypothetical protein
MVLENHESSPIRLTGVKINGINSSFCRTGQAASSEILLDTGQSIAIDVPANVSSESKSISVNISIYYTGSSGLSNVQLGANPLYVTNDLPPISCAVKSESCAVLACCSNLTCVENMGNICCIVSGCFLAGTLVLTPSGEVPIEQLTAGDSVYSFGENGEISISAVAAKSVSMRESHYTVVAGEFEANATAEHPFLTPQGYVEASLLSAGDIVLVYRGGSLDEEVVTSVFEIPFLSEVHNLQVEGDHTFFANGFAVHNKPPGEYDCEPE